MTRFLSTSLLVLALLMATIWLHQDQRDDKAADQAALEQYRERTGRTDATVAHSSRYDDCALVALTSTDGHGLASVAMKRVGRDWITGRSTEDEEASFDSDDVGSHRDCMSVADSSGPLVNGGPPE